MSNDTVVTKHNSLLARALRRLRRDKRGAEFVEMLIITVLVALGGAAAMRTLGQTISNATNSTGQNIRSVLGL